MSNEVVTTKESKMTEYVPFGSQDKIKLSIDMVKNLVAVKTKSGKTCSDADAIKFIAMCQARRLNPFEGDAFLIGYDGREGPTFSLITAHQAFLKRAELNPEYDGMKSGIIVEEDGQLKDLEGDFFHKGQKVVGGWSTIFFKNRKHPMHKRVRLERFQKSFGVWQDDSAGMICKCAEADGLRSAFPTMLGGLYIKEETQVIEAPKVTAPIFTAPEQPKEEKPPVDAPEGLKDAFEEARATASEESSLDKVKAVRGLIKLAGITEKKVIDFLALIGTIDADIKDIEHLPNDVLELLYEQWSDIAQRIKEAK